MLFPGNLGETDLVKLSKLKNCDLIFISESLSQKIRASNCLSKTKVFLCKDLIDNQKINQIKSLNLNDIKKISLLFNNLCSDVSFNWIAERTYRKGGLVSNFLFSNELVSIVKNLYFFLKQSYLID